MKLKYIISALFAGAALFVACTEENPIKVSELTANLSPSVVGLDVAEGTATVTINSAEAWTASTDSTWVHFSPASGGAGTTDVVVTVDENKGRERTAVITVVSAGVKSLLTVIQAGVPHGLLPDDPLTPTEAKELCTALDQGASAPKPYYVKGVVCKLVDISPVGSYNNVTFWLDEEADGDGLFEVYRAKWLDNGDVPSADCVHVGDIVMVYGTIMNYKGTAETSQGNAYVYSIEEGETPSLSADAEKKTAEFSDVSAKFTITGNNLTGSITIAKDEAATWITKYTTELPGEGGDLVIEFAANNVTEDRTAKFTVSSDGAESIELILTQGAFLDKGTASTPYTVAEALEVIAKLGDGQTTSADVYTSGVITAVKEVNPTYGNATYLISDNGSSENTITVFRGKYLEAASFTSEDQLAVGDVVVVKGKLQNYVKDEVHTPEIAQGNSLYSIERPITVAASLEEIGKMEDGATAADEVLVIGVVNSENGIDTSFGNATFDIVDAGSESALKVFRAYDFGNVKFTSADVFKKGDLVVVKGKLQRYVKDEVMTPELSKGHLVAVFPGSAAPTE